MKTYEGRREGYVAEVTVNGVSLNPRLDLWNHSPTGFEWGYGGSGPAQLALALLADDLGDDNEAVQLHQEFKRAVVAKLDRRRWTLTSEQIRQAVDALRAGLPVVVVATGHQKGGSDGRSLFHL